MPEVKIISATYPIYDPYIKTPEQLIEDRYTKSNMIQATVEIKTTRTIGFDIINNSQSFSFHILKYPEILEYEYGDVESFFPDDISKQEDFFGIQMDAWNSSVEYYKKLKDMGLPEDYIREYLPDAITGITFDMCGKIPQWQEWLTNTIIKSDKDYLINSMIRKTLNKYFPSHIDYIK